jgi:UDP-N-acetylglucosamine enolpyruvyl transferase
MFVSAIHAKTFFSKIKIITKSVLNGNVVVNTENKNLKVKNIENIESWTDAFCNFAKIALQRHPMLATDLISYMILIRAAVQGKIYVLKPPYFFL